MLQPLRNVGAIMMHRFEKAETYEVAAETELGR